MFIIDYKKVFTQDLKEMPDLYEKIIFNDLKAQELLF